MSGLLVKSVGVMKENLEEMNAQGVNVPVLLGGAALTRDYAEEDLASLYRGPLLYCRDAFEGLHRMDAIAAGKLDEVLIEQKTRVEKRRRLRETAARPQSLDSANAKPIDKKTPVPLPPSGADDRHRSLPKHLFPYINPNALSAASGASNKASSRTMNSTAV